MHADPHSTTGAAIAHLRRLLTPTSFRLRVVAALWIPLSMVIQLCRSSHTPVWDDIWAEDGRFFYGEALSHPWSATLGKPLANYLQLAPRLLAELAAQFPVSQAAFVISVSAAATASLLSVYIFAATRGVVPRQWQRYAIAVVAAVHPAGAYEVNAALNNLHWYLIFAAFWACLASGTSRGRIGLNVVVVSLAVLSDPLAGLLLPILVFRIFRKDLGARWTAAAMILAGAAQFVWGVTGVPRHAARTPAQLPLVYGLRVAGSFLLGDQTIKVWWDQYGRPLAVLSLLVVIVGFAIAAGLATTAERRLLAILLGYSVIFFLAPFLTRGGGAALLRHPATLNGSRYMIVPLWFLYSGLFVAAGVRPGTRWPFRSAALPAFKVAIVPCLAVLLVGSQLVLNFAPPSPRTLSRSWKAGVTVARSLCREKPPTATPNDLARPVLLAPGTVAIPVAPWGKNYFWAVRLSCDHLT